MFISMAPVTHPTRSNYTWFQTKFGADSFTLQYSEMSRYCVPQPQLTGKHCDIYIGVLGWLNTTFTIMATADEGFLAPIRLLDQTPQSGYVANAEYTYYTYSVSVPQPPSQQGGGDSMPALDIKVTLTPTSKSCHVMCTRTDLFACR